MEIHRVSRDLWGIFKHYHYLTSAIANNSECYVGFIEHEPVAFVALNRFPHPVNKNIVKIGRIVVLPHWQGYKIGMKMVEHICEHYYSDRELRITTTLPIIHKYLFKRSSLWHLRFQGVRKAEDAGKTSSMSKDVRECYLETYQFKNKMFVNDTITRTRCPQEQIKVYDTLMKGGYHND